MEYRKGTIKDLNLLVESRMKVLKVINNLNENEDLSFLRKEVKNYYENALATGEHIAYLVYDKEDVVGTGDVSFYKVMPSYHNPTGKTAFLINIYTEPKYRGQGIASKVLDLLVKESKNKGITNITLDTTAMGRRVYEKYGFKDVCDIMELS